MERVQNTLRQEKKNPSQNKQKRYSVGTVEEIQQRY